MQLKESFGGFPFFPEYRYGCRTAGHALAITTVLVLCLCLVPASVPAEWDTSDFIESGIDISADVERFMKCNRTLISQKTCEDLPRADEYLLDAQALERLRQYQFILMPGGDYDFFSELLGICKGASSEDIDDFREENPVGAFRLEQYVQRNVCPDYDADPDHLYNTFMGAYKSYISFMEENGIPVKRLGFSHEIQTEFVGDRIQKLNLLASTIDELEEDGVPDDMKFVIIGHSFGGINTSDFLVELVNGHGSDTPEGRAFADTAVRQWSESKKAEIFDQVKAAVFLNTFVQGDKSSETAMLRIAESQGLKSQDPVGYYIDYVLQHYAAGSYPSETPWNKILHFVLRSNRYRVDYYLQDQNTLSGAGGTHVQDAFDAIADGVVLISVGCIVPRHFPALRVGATFIADQSREKYTMENEPNDGLVDCYGAMFPRESTEYAVLSGYDHGSLVLKPRVPGITNGKNYNQVPFIKTLLKRIDYKLHQQ